MAEPESPKRVGAKHRLVRIRDNRWVTGSTMVLLCLVLGVALVAQVRRTQTGEGLAEARPQDLIVLLDGLQTKEAALRKEIAESEATLRRLQEGGTASAAALDEARRRVTALAVLTGTVPVAGPGLRVEINDGTGKLGPEVLLDVIQELRNAGAEALQAGPVRVGVDTALTGADGLIRIDGTTLTLPYVITAIGDPPTLAAALNIPGGVVDTVERKGGSTRIQQQERVEITALRAERKQKYARPAG
ncbi:DUF881 domain-containing protein [Crossiella cryophila]|uniref:Uncharacterized protein YlxW (UPF0749 family) n=1 Tax=Crossiella cryophila TaxID=43355 RepID=A0A7W7CAM3_9PSEU|nr:DUF881 domain-containing protein [Crossiella cryophila]MBB4677580.1 uncharacterized protein YlxW (UPF0749 family) [Crossiella cryophila]